MDYNKLKAQIQEWNANRLDLFELTLPSQDLEFHGVMRFFYQDEENKVTTKCVRVSSTASTVDVLETLIEKFRPNMSFKTFPKYALYEIHSNGEERKIQLHELPLYIQLNWGKDDREGRFLFRDETNKSTKLHSSLYTTDQQRKVDDETPVPFKRKLSRREKKEKKKADKEAKLNKGKENELPDTAGGKKGEVASRLYNELPETSFTRSISNPEAVMKRRRQMKLERKLQQFKSADGGPDTGGTLKIYGESIDLTVPYKTLLLSTTDTARDVVLQTLEKYGKPTSLADQYCLVQIIVPPSGHEYHGDGSRRECVLNPDDCPLAILMNHQPGSGTVMFHLRERQASQQPLPTLHHGHQGLLGRGQRSRDL